MNKLLLSLALLGTLAFSAAAAENSSFDQLLKDITVAEPFQFPEPALEKVALNAGEGRYWGTVKAADRDARTRLLEAGLDIVEIGKDSVSGFAGPYTMGVLSSKAFVVESRKTMGEYFAAAAGKDFPAADAAYHNYKETTDLLKSMAAKNPDIASVFSIGKTTEGRDIWCLRINSSAKGAAASSKPGALYLGNHHAREHLSNEVPLLLGAWLLHHRNDERSRIT